MLKENNLQNLTDHNMTTFISRFSSTVSTDIFFVFSNTGVPNNVENLNYIKLKPGSGNKIILSGNETNGYIYILELRISNTSHNMFQALEVLSGNSDSISIFYVKSTSLNSDNSILTLSNVACTNTQAIYYNVPFINNGVIINTPGFINGLATGNDPGYFKIETPQPPQPSGDIGTGGTTGTITNPSGDTTGKVDLSGIEQGIGNINQNIDKTNEKLDGISGEINELNNSVNNINNFLSGDITKNSDDIKGSLTIDTSEIDDPSEDFFTWVFNQIQNVFISTEEQSFNFKLFTENEYTVSSSQIYVPDSVIKTLISYASAFGIYYWIIKDVRKTTNKIKEGNIENLGNEDVTANLL